MKAIRHLFTFTVILAAAISAFGAPVDVPRGIDHTSYDALLKKYVNDRGLVNYKAWKETAADLKTLHDYTAKFSAGAPFADSKEKAASLINAYNALTLQWILDNYPTKSIKSTSNPWGAKRHPVGGRTISLDEIEQETLRPQIGFRTHGTLVCAARSCPPLRAGAYTADKLDEQLDDAMRRWLAREDLNNFQPDKKRADLSKIFSWYGDDFKKADGGIRTVLTKYAPSTLAEFLKSDYKIDFQSYNWSLNEQ